MTDGELRYYLYRFLTINFYTTSRKGIITIKNFWLDFCKHSSLSLTEQKIKRFKEKMYRVFNISFEQGVTNVGRSEASLQALNDAFGEFGITLTSSSSELHFIMPDNTDVRFFTSLTFSALVLTSFRQITPYATEVYPYMTGEKYEKKDINTLKNRSSDDSWYTYDKDSYAYTIHGTGTTYGVNTAFASGLIEDAAEATTIIFEKTITSLASGSTYLADGSSNMNSNRLSIFVFKHDPSDELTLQSGWIISPKSATNPKWTVNIYTDHDAPRNFSYSNNITVVFHPLSEWSDQ